MVEPLVWPTPSRVTWLLRRAACATSMAVVIAAGGTARAQGAGRPTVNAQAGPTVTGTPAGPASQPPATPGRVEVSADAAAAAETLFQEARALVEKKLYGEACPKFAESQRLDPGIGTLMNLGDCFEKAGKFASAWATYREAIAEANRSGQKQRERDAVVLAARVETKLSRIVVRVPESSMRPGLQVQRDNVVVDRAQWGILIPIDAGEHTMSAQAPNHAPWSTKIVIGEATRHELAIPSLEPLPAPPPGQDVDRGRGQRTIGFVIGGVGVASLAAGGVLGLMAMNLRSDAKRMGCDDVACATPEAKSKNDSALDAANISTVLFVTGGVVTAAGLVLVLTAPGRSPAPQSAVAARAPNRRAPSPWLGAAVRGPAIVVEGRF